MIFFKAERLRDHWLVHTTANDSLRLSCKESYANTTIDIGLASTGRRVEVKGNKADLMAAMLTALNRPLHVLDVRRNGTGAHGTWSQLEFATLIPAKLPADREYDYVHLQCLAPSVELLAAKQLPWRQFRELYVAELSDDDLSVGEAFVEAAAKDGGMVALMCAEAYHPNFDGLPEERKENEYCKDKEFCHRFPLAKLIARRLRSRHPGLTVRLLHLDLVDFYHAKQAGQQYRPRTSDDLARNGEPSHAAPGGGTAPASHVPLPAAASPQSPASRHLVKGIPAVRKAPSRVIPYSAQTVTDYEQFDQLIRGFPDGKMSLLIVGPPGVQKTRTIEALLGDRVSRITGHTTAWGLYRDLYDLRDRLLVLDDLDDLYAKADVVAILKSVTETAKKKTVGWRSDRTRRDEGVPQSFKTTSQAIVIANRWRSGNDDVVALEDRCITVFFQPSPAQVHARAKAWVMPQDPEVYDFIGDHLDRCRELSMRVYDKAMYFKCCYLTEWKTHVLELLGPGTQAEEPRQLVLTQQAAQDPLRLVQELQAADFRQEGDRVRAFQERTGRSPATYYRILAKLRNGKS